MVKKKKKKFTFPLSFLFTVFAILKMLIIPTAILIKRGTSLIKKDLVSFEELIVRRKPGRTTSQLWPIQGPMSQQLLHLPMKLSIATRPTSTPSLLITDQGQKKPKSQKAKPRV